MIENRWLLFAVYFVGMLALRLLFYRNDTIHLAEHIFITFFSAALLAYFDKHLRRLLVYVIQKIIPRLTGSKSKEQ